MSGSNPEIKTEEGPLVPESDLNAVAAIGEKNAPVEGYMSSETQPPRSRQEQAIDATLETAQNASAIKDGVDAQTVVAQHAEQHGVEDSRNLEEIRKQIESQDGQKAA